MLQTPHLFSGTVRENIRYGRLEATDGEVEEAAKIAGAHDFIVTLSKGYEENVGEGGNLLSVGQKQLISLARAVLAQPELFVMDEATSSVDTLTEALIQRGMENLMRGRTTFIIAHRLSTIRRADRILVIEDGRIAEHGTHAELLRQRGHYYRMYTQQFRHELEVQYGVVEPQAPLPASCPPWRTKPPSPARTSAGAQSPRCRSASYRSSAAATLTFSELTWPCMGMRTCTSAWFSHRSERPASSVPMAMATGPERSACW